MGYLKCTGMKTQDIDVLLILKVLGLYGWQSVFLSWNHCFCAQITK